MTAAGAEAVAARVSRVEVQRAAGGELPTTAEFTAWARAALDPEVPPAELVVRVVEEAESAELNQAYRHKSGPTNVLSFPFEAPPGVPVHHLGDLVICAPVVRREAAEQDKAVRAHWAHMVVHGVLHLRGFDHQRDDEALVMEALETEILARLGYPNPYG